MDPVSLVSALVSLAVEVARIVQGNIELRSEHEDLLTTLLVIQNSIETLNPEQTQTYRSALQALVDSMQNTKQILEIINKKLSQKGIFSFYVSPEKEIAKLAQLKVKILNCVNVLTMALSVKSVTDGTNKFDASKLMNHTSAKKFWLRNFGAEANQVKWSLFQSAFVNGNSLPVTMINNQNLELLKRQLTKNFEASNFEIQDPFVTAYDFASFTDDYGVFQSFQRLVDPDCLELQLPPSVGSRDEVVARSLFVIGASITDVSEICPVRTILEQNGQSCILKFFRFNNGVIVEYHDASFSAPATLLSMQENGSLMLRGLMERNIKLASAPETVDELATKERLSYQRRQFKLSQEVSKGEKDLYSKEESHEVLVAKARAEMKLLILEEELENKISIEKTDFQVKIDKLESEMQLRYVEMEMEKDPAKKLLLSEQITVDMERRRDEITKRHNELQQSILTLNEENHNIFRKTFPWFTGLFQKQGDELQRHFNEIFPNLKEKSVVLADYTCGLFNFGQSLPVAGSIYITSNGVYFNSSTAFQEMRFTINFDTLSLLEKENYLGIFPTALRFKCEGKEKGKTMLIVGLAQRDETYTMITNTWKSMNELKRDKLGGKVQVSQQRSYYVASYTLIKSGFLRKQGDWLKRWKSRFFILSDKEFSYAESETSEIINTIALNEVSRIQEESVTNGGFNFRVVTPNRAFLLDAASIEERREWMEAIESVRKSTQQRFFFGVWSYPDVLNAVESVSSGIFSGPAVNLSDNVKWTVLEIDFLQDTVRLLYKGKQNFYLKFEKILSCEADSDHILKFTLKTIVSDEAIVLYCQSKIERNTVVRILRRVKNQGNEVIDEMISKLSDLSKSKGTLGFQTSIKDFFKKFDLDGNGVLSPDEISLQVQEAESRSIKKELQDMHKNVRISIQSDLQYATEGLIWVNRYVMLERAPMGNRVIVFDSKTDIDPLKVISLNHAVAIKTDSSIIALYTCCRKRSFCFRINSQELMSKWMMELNSAISELDKSNLPVSFDDCGADQFTSLNTNNASASSNFGRISAPTINVISPSASFLEVTSHLSTHRNTVSTPGVAASGSKSNNSEFMRLLKDKDNEIDAFKSMLVEKEEVLERTALAYKDELVARNLAQKETENCKISMIRMETRLFEVEVFALKSGTIFQKFISSNSSAEPHSRFLFLSENSGSISWSSNALRDRISDSISLYDISCVYLGSESEFFKSKFPHSIAENCVLYYLLETDLSTCFSIIAVNRDLHLQNLNPDVTLLWVRTLNKLVYQIKNTCPAPNTESAFSNPVYRDVT